MLWQAINTDQGEPVVRVPTSFDKARTLIRNIQVDLGHLGSRAVIDTLSSRLWLLDVTALTEGVVKSCNKCQFTRREALQPALLHLLPRVEVFDVWAFNWIGLLPKTHRNNQYILTAMDHGTGFAYAEAHPQRSYEAVLALLWYIITAHGKPKAVLTDNGTEFIAYEHLNYLQRLDITHLRTLPYHPQTNGKLEKFNDNLTQVLAHFTAPNHHDQWDEYLADALLAHHVHSSSTTGASPTYMAYGRELPLPSESTHDALRRPPTDAEIETLQHQHLEHIHNLARFCTKANTRALKCLKDLTLRHEANYKDCGLTIGNFVLRRSPKSSKIHLRWDGPFIIHDLTDWNTYQLRTQNGYILRTLYNAEQLKPYRSPISNPPLWHSSTGMMPRRASSTTVLFKPTLNDLSMAFLLVCSFHFIVITVLLSSVPLLLTPPRLDSASSGEGGGVTPHTVPARLPIYTCLRLPSLA